jgi:hypothetical protein
LALGAEEVPESKEPPLLQVLEIDGKAIEIKEGVPVQIKGDFKDPTVVLKVAPYRIFPYVGMQFRYPRGFAFEADHSVEGLGIWTLTGNDLTIMVFDMAGEMTTAEFAETMMEQFGRDQCHVTNADAKETFGKRTLEAYEFRCKIVGETMDVTLFQVSRKGGRSRMLALQETKGDDGQRAKEVTETLRLLKDSLELTK